MHGCRRDAVDGMHQSGLLSGRLRRKGSLTHAVRECQVHASGPGPMHAGVFVVDLAPGWPVARGGKHAEQAEEGVEEEAADLEVGTRGSNGRRDLAAER